MGSPESSAGVRVTGIGRTFMTLEYGVKTPQSLNWVFPRGRVGTRKWDAGYMDTV